MSEGKALVILMDGVEELEAVAPIDCLRRAGVETVTASAGGQPNVAGRNGIQLVADQLLGDALKEDYAMVVVPGGPGHAALMEDERILSLLRSQEAAGRLTGSICAGPLVLDKAGLLEGRQFTSFPGTTGDLPRRDPARRVVRDGTVITSQGAGTAIEFALALVGALKGEAVAAEIAASICH
jgi:4-methyl-5(b-hydroxyethyl)-thiazole monophosphate biosynthesis